MLVRAMKRPSLLRSLQTLHLRLTKTLNLPRYPYLPVSVSLVAMYCSDIVMCCKDQKIQHDQTCKAVVNKQQQYNRGSPHYTPRYVPSRETQTIDWVRTLIASQPASLALHCPQARWWALAVQSLFSIPCLAENP